MRARVCLHVRMCVCEGVRGERKREREEEGGREQGGRGGGDIVF